MSEFDAGARLQLSLFAKSPAYLLLLISVPFFGAIFLSVEHYAHDPAVVPQAILAPALMGVWIIAVALADMIIFMERGYGTLEFIAAAPASPSRLIAGRVAAITLVGLAVIPEALLVARAGFGDSLTIFHPGVFVLALLANAVATAATALAMTALFLAFRSVSRYVNALGYPFYILGGVILPARYLPAWIRPVSDVIYLHWTSALMYASASRAPVPGVPRSLVAVAVLAAASFAAGHWLLSRAVARLRENGRLS